MTDLLRIDWLDGIAYVTDPAGRIAAYGRPNWNRFAKENDAPDLCEAQNVIGLDLFAVIQGDDVRRAYRRIVRELAEGRREGFAFGFRCDAPDVKREMRMAITPLRLGGQVTGILFQSVLLGSEMRPPLDIFRFRELSAVLGQDREWPIVTVCSWCQKVKADAWGSDPRWIPAEEYYRRGGEAEVRISHGICQDCSASLLGAGRLAFASDACRLAPERHRVDEALAAGDRAACAQEGLYLTDVTHSGHTS